jgi:hypothetical protein
MQLLVGQFSPVILTGAGGVREQADGLRADIVRERSARPTSVTRLDAIQGRMDRYARALQGRPRVGV